MTYQNKLKKGVVLVTVVIFVLILSILAVTVLFIMTNEARITEHQIRRIRAQYAIQAGVQHYLELLKSAASPGVIPITVDGFTVTTNLSGPPNVSPCPQGAPNASCITATTNY